MGSALRRGIAILSDDPGERRSYSAGGFPRRFYRKGLMGHSCLHWQMHYVEAGAKCILPQIPVVIR